MTSIDTSINTSRSTTTQRARRAGSLSLAIAGTLACLALAPTVAHASQVTTEGGTYARSGGIDDSVTARKQQLVRDFARPGPSHSVSPVSYVFALRPGCDIPQSLDDWSRRLIAVQVCSQTQLVPARTLARVAYVEPIPEPELASASVGHCGHEALHQPSAASGLPVSTWYTPTSC